MAQAPSFVIQNDNGAAVRAQINQVLAAVVTTHSGGIEAAIETFKSNPTPNLIILETSLQPSEIPGTLERLAEVCDASTRLIVLGHVNDVVLYRELIRSGVSEYIVLPASSSAVERNGLMSSPPRRV